VVITSVLFIKNLIHHSAVYTIFRMVERISFQFVDTSVLWVCVERNLYGERISVYHYYGRRFFSKEGLSILFPVRTMVLVQA